MMKLWLTLTLALAAPPAPIEIVVESGRYVPAEVTVPADQPATLQFTRKEWNSCTREVVFPTLDLRRELPPEQPKVVVEAR